MLHTTNTKTKTYLVTCSGIEETRRTTAAAKERASFLSVAFCPQPARVLDNEANVVCFYVDGQEYPPELLDLTREPEKEGTS